MDGVLDAPPPPSKLAGGGFSVVPCLSGAGLPGLVAGMVQIYLNFVRKCSYLLNNYLSLYLHFLLT